MPPEVHDMNEARIRRWVEAVPSLLETGRLEQRCNGRNDLGHALCLNCRHEPEVCALGYDAGSPHIGTTALSAA